MTTKTPALFASADSNEREKPTSIGGRWETPVELATSFAAAARTLAETWADSQIQGRELPLALPIIQTYRHALELALKAQCVEAARIVRAAAAAGYGDDTVPHDLDEQLGSTHSIAKLTGVLETVLVGLRVDEASRELPQDVQKTLRFLHNVDARGTAFRYSTDRVPGSKPARWEQVRPHEVPIYLHSAVARLSDAFDLLMDGLGGYLDIYEQLLQELREQFEGG